MTKQEAIDLEKQCEEWITSELKRNYLVGDETLVTVGLTLTSRLRITYSNFAFVMSKNLYENEFYYIYYAGDWDDLLLIRQSICVAIQNHIEDFEKLIWSYENRRELED